MKNSPISFNQTSILAVLRQRYIGSLSNWGETLTQTEGIHGINKLRKAAEGPSIHI